MIKPTVRVLYADRVAAKLTNPDMIAKPLHRLLADVAPEAQRAAAGAGGREIAASLHSEIRSAHSAVISTHPAARAIDVGRRAGAPMPPPGAIRSWVAAHAPGVRPFVIARAIGRRGIRGRFFARAAVAQVKRSMPGQLRRLGSDVVREWKS